MERVSSPVLANGGESMRLVVLICRRGVLFLLGRAWRRLGRLGNLMPTGKISSASISRANPDTQAPYKTAKGTNLTAGFTAVAPGSRLNRDLYGHGVDSPMRREKSARRRQAERRSKPKATVNYDGLNNYRLAFDAAFDRSKPPRHDPRRGSGRRNNRFTARQAETGR